METAVVDAAPVSAPSSAPPPASAPTPVSGGFDANLDAVFSRANGAESAPKGGDAPAELPEVIDADTADAPPVEAAATEEIVDEAAAPIAEPVAELPAEDVEFLEEITPDSISPNGKQYHYTKTKAERLMAADKAMRQLRELDPGITVDSIAKMHTTNIELERMFADYDSGKPKEVAEAAHDFIGLVKNPNNPSQYMPGQHFNPVSAGLLAENAVRIAENYSPESFKAIQNSILLRVAQQNYQKFLQTRDESAKMLAWNLDHMVHGDKGNYARYQGDPASAPVQDPHAEEIARFQREKQTYEQQRFRDRQAQIANAVSSAESDAKSAVDELVNTALSTIQANVREQKPAEFKHALRDLQEKFVEATKDNPNYQTPRNVLLSKLRLNPTQEARSALVDFDKRWAASIIGKAKIEVVSRFSNTVTQQVAAANAKQEKLQERREPNGNGGNPVQRLTLKQALSDKKTGYDKGWDLFGAALQRR